MPDITPDNPLPSDVAIGNPVGINPNDMSAVSDAAQLPETLPAPPQPPPEAPGAPAPPQAPAGGPGISPEGLLKKANSLAATAHNAGATERKDLLLAESERVKAANAAAGADAAEAEALKPVMAHHADQVQTLEHAQQEVRTRWQNEQQRLAVQDADMNNLYDDFLKRSHPSDIWGAAGVNPIVGRIAVALAGINSAVNGGPNQQLEYIKTLAATRAHQLEQEGQALGLKKSALAQLHANSSERMHDASAANDKLRAMLLDSTAAQIDQVANNFRDPKAKAKAMDMIAQVKQEAAKLRADSYQKELQTGMQSVMAGINVFDHLAAAAAKTKEDKTQTRQIEDAAASVSQLLTLVSQLKSNGVDPMANGAIRSQIATVLAKAENPGSNRVLNGPGREAELAKMGGVGIPFSHGKLRLGDDPDSLAMNALRQQYQRDQQAGTHTVDVILQNHPEWAAAWAAAQGAPVQ